MGRLTLPPYSKVKSLDGTGNFAVKKYYLWPFSFIYRKKLKLITQLLERQNYYNILDFGCGDANIFYPELSKYAKFVKSVDRPENIDLRCKFDVVVCASVLEFVDLPVSVARLKLVTPSNGIIVGASVMDTWLTRLYFKLIGDKRKRHTQKEIMAEINKRFFVVKYEEWFGIYFSFKGYPK